MENKLRLAHWSGVQRFVAAACMVSVTLLAGLIPMTTSAADTSSNGLSFIPVCSLPARGSAACMSIRVEGIRQAASTSAYALPSGFGPADLQSAYNMSGMASTNGTGKTVAIVDAYDDPTALADVCLYRSTYSLPALQQCSGGSTGPTFTKIDQNGGTSYPVVNTGWAQEISLDVDMVSAMCPNCNILLVESNDNTNDNLGAAVNTAAGWPGVVAISNSYGGSEDSTETSYDTYYNHPGIAVTASSGDSGYGVEYPAASPYVTAVGGTSLKRASNARGWSESAWTCKGSLNCALLGGAGSGCSKYESAQPWQTSLGLSGCSKRMVADISAVADPSTGVAVRYNGAWSVYGGTSVASPLIGAVYALIGNYSATVNPYPAKLFYAHASQLHDVTTSLTAVTCSPSYLCNAAAGYDGPTGVGTP